MDVSMLPDEIQEPMRILYQEICSLRMKVDLFMQVYGESAEKVRLLNRTAPLFFNVCQNAQFYDIVLCLCRLTEKPRSQRRTNLSLQFLVESVNKECYGQLRSALEQKARDLEVMSRELRQYRNRRIAHRDYDTARGVQPLDPLAMSRVTDATTLVEDLFYSVLEYFRPDVEFGTRIFGLIGDGNSLVQALEDAERYRELGHKTR